MSAAAHLPLSVHRVLQFAVALMAGRVAKAMMDFGVEAVAEEEEAYRLKKGLSAIRSKVFGATSTAA